MTPNRGTGERRGPAATRPKRSVLTGLLTAAALFAAFGPLGLAPAIAQKSPPRLVAEPILTVPAPRLKPEWIAALEPPSRSAYRTKARNAIIYDLTGEEALFERGADDSIPPASMTKLMTLLIALQAVADGDLRLDQKVRVSKNAAGRPGSSMYLRAGERPTLRELLYGTMVVSGNDAATAVAEAVAGSEKAFVERMNAAAWVLGMKNSRFRNPTGWPAKGHVMSAGDLALLAAHLHRHHPEAKPFLRRRHFKWGGATQRNRNPLLFVDLSDIGVVVDGMKTGYTSAAGYCAVVSAVERRKNLPPRRVIAVIAGLSSEAARAREAEAAIRWAFAQEPDRRAEAIGGP